MRDWLVTILYAPTETSKEIRALMERMDTLAWSMIPGAIRYDKPRVQTSPVDRLAEAMGSIDEAQRELAFLDQRRRKEESRIRELCMACEDLTEQERYVILKRYMYREKWESIAYWLDLSDRRIYTIHGSAVDKLEAFLSAGDNKMCTQ